MKTITIAPTIRAGDLEQRVDGILDQLAARAARKKITSTSCAHLRDDLVDLVRCAVAAEALDHALGRTLVTVRALGRPLPCPGPALLVTRHIWNEARPARFPSLHVIPAPAPGPTLEAYADFADPDDSAISTLAGTTWCLAVVASEGGRTRVQLDATALSAGASSPTWRFTSCTARRTRSG